MLKGRSQVLLVAAVGCTQAAAPAAQSERGAEYGDAPDGITAGYREHGKDLAVTGRFPTRASSSGARILVPDRLWLGSAGSLESDADDAADPDGRPNLASDSDDGLISLLLDDGASARARLTLSVGQRGIDGDVYLNVLVDLNRDGRWGGSGKGGEPEWVIANYAIAMNGSGGRQIQQDFTYSNGDVVPREAWMRVLVSDQRVSEGWDGTGTFERGEVEDHLVEMSQQSSLLDVDCNNPSTGNGAWQFDGQRTVHVQCKLTRLEAGAEHDVQFELARESGGVRHTGFCGTATVETARAGAQAQVGPLRVGSQPSVVGCLYERDGALPSKWSFELKLAPVPSSPTERGVYLGHAGRLSTPFEFGKGICAKSCTGDRQCFGGEVCRDRCCGPAWAPACAGLDAESCGRCCAISGGVSAPDCVRQACIH